MNLSPRNGCILFVIGIGFCLLTFGLSGGTERACQEISGIIYETVGIHLPGFRITGVDLVNLELHWYDGCNWRDGPLLPLLFGVGCSTAGLVIARR